MSTKDWFRHTTWNDDDQQDFFARLSRARKHNRPQYAAIQASYLLDSHQRGNVQAALNLLDLGLQESAAGGSELENLHHLQGRCLEQLGQADEALEAYRLALQARQNAPGIRTQAPLDFAFLVVRERRTDLYAETLDVLTEQVMPVDVLFPDAQFRYCAAFAIILQHAGEPEKARDFATKALQAASRTSSGLSWHPHIGLVRTVDKGIESRLKKILGLRGWLRLRR